MKFLFAGNHDEAAHWRRHNGLARYEVIEFTTRHPALLGLRLEPGDEIVRIGTWYERRDAAKIEDLIARLEIDRDQRAVAAAKAAGDTVLLELSIDESHALGASLAWLVDHGSAMAGIEDVLARLRAATQAVGDVALNRAHAIAERDRRRFRVLPTS